MFRNPTLNRHHWLFLDEPYLSWELILLGIIVGLWLGARAQ